MLNTIVSTFYKLKKTTTLTHISLLHLSLIVFAYDEYQSPEAQPQLLYKICRQSKHELESVCDDHHRLLLYVFATSSFVDCCLHLWSGYLVHHSSLYSLACQQGDSYYLQQCRRCLFQYYKQCILKLMVGRNDKFIFDIEYLTTPLYIGCRLHSVTHRWFTIISIVTSSLMLCSLDSQLPYSNHYCLCSKPFSH